MGLGIAGNYRGDTSGGRGVANHSSPYKIYLVETEAAWSGIQWRTDDIETYPKYKANHDEIKPLNLVS